MKKTKILYVITKGNFGGAQRYVFDLATGLPKEQYDVAVAIGTKDGDELKKRLEGSGIRTIPLSALGRDVSVRKDTESFWTLWQIIKSERPDILHLNSPKAAGLGTLIGRLLRVQNIIVTAHGWTWNEDRSSIQKILIKCVSLVTLMLAHTTITISQRECGQALAIPFAPKKKIVTISNGITPPQTLSRKDAEEQLGLPFVPMTVTIGAIGELHKNKGFEYLISGYYDLAQDRSTRLVIIGDGEERETLATLIKTLGLSEKVFLVGARKEASQFLSAFDIYTLSSIKEGLPYVLLEAGSAGLPIISTDVGGIRELISDMEDGILIKPRNATEITSAITYLLEHSDKQKIFGKNIQQKIVRDFSVTTMREKTYSLYK